MELTKEQITKGNELIAEFMNMKTGMTYQLINSDLNLSTIDIERTFCYSNGLKFHIDWNWLISVLNKIYSSDEYIIYKNESAFFFGIDINTQFIEVTWGKVIEFIEWYNLNLKNE